jgi:hypothetical protein
MILQRVPTTDNIHIGYLLGYLLGGSPKLGFNLIRTTF